MSAPPPYETSREIAEQIVRTRKKRHEHNGSGQDADSDFSPQPFAAPWPAPLGEAAYHGITGEVVRLIAPQSESDPAALLFHFLAFAGNSAGNQTWLQIEATRHSANLFLAIVGDTSKARKGTSERWIRGVFRHAAPDWEQNRTTSGLSTGEGLIERVRDPRVESKFDKQTGTWDEKTVDPGIADKRLLIVESELARPLRVMNRPENTLSMVMRDAWDGSRLGIMTRNRPITATGAHVSVVGHITIVELRSELTEIQTANGFGNRCLFACAKRSQLLPFGGHVDNAAMLELANKLEAILGGLPHDNLTLDPAARERWIDIYPELSKGGARLFDAMTARSEAQALRVALIYALLDQQSRIGLAHLDAALEIIRYSNDSVRHIFGDATGNRIADTIIGALRANPAGMTRAEISSGLFGRNVPANEISSALALLLEHGMARFARESTTGRPKETWLAC